MSSWSPIDCPLLQDTYSKCCWPKRKSRPYLILSRGRAEPESGRSLTDSSAQHSLTNQQTNRPNDSFSQPETQPIMVMECKSTQLPPLCTRCQQHPQKPLVDGDISNSSLRDVDKAALEDELTAYMNELARRQLSWERRLGRKNKRSSRNPNKYQANGLENVTRLVAWIALIDLFNNWFFVKEFLDEIRRYWNWC